MKNIEISFQGIEGIDAKCADAARNTLLTKSGPGADFTGWVDLPVDYDKDEFARIKAAAEKIRSDSDILIVCGIGGSYLGAAAAIDFLKGTMLNINALQGREPLQIYFAGNNMSPSYISSIVEIIGDHAFSVNVISKSGTTMETSVSFRIFKEMLEKKYGAEGAAKRIYATTSRDTGALKALSDKNGYETFIIPDDIGGRYSVLTAVGLLPIAATGCDIDALMQGAADMRSYLLSDESDEAKCYAVARQNLYKKGKMIEIFASYDPDLRMIGEWNKQLFGESEGKDGKGIFPASVNLTADLHSMGQMIQDGERNIFETVINVAEPYKDICIPAFEDDFDGLKYVEGKPVSMLNEAAMTGTAIAHLSNDVPQIRITIPKRDEYSLGSLFYFLEFSCGVSAYIEGVNPFNQPGVEEYKKQIKILLKK